jgi:hypothetical protein
MSSETPLTMTPAFLMTRPAVFLNFLAASGRRNPTGRSSIGGGAGHHGDGHAVSADETLF